MKDPAIKNQVQRLYFVEKWKIGTIAKQLGIHHNTVKNMIEKKEDDAKKRKPRKRMIDRYMPFILQTLEKYPAITASRLYDMIKGRGYPGKPSHFRDIISTIRPRKPAEAYLRLSSLPGEQAQVDWAHFGRMQVGKASRPLMAFVLVLSYSRAVFLQFFLSSKLGDFMRGHRGAFEFFNGVTRSCLYDNLKSVVLERIGSNIRFNPDFLDFSGYYRFAPKPVAVGRGNEKGRVERTIRYIRSNFFQARKFKTIQDLNQQALLWCTKESMSRNWPDNKDRTVGDAFEEERHKLIALPDNPYPCHDRCEVSVGKYPYIRFDLNDYSVPHTYALTTLTVHASMDDVRIIDGNTLVAVHKRSYDRGKRIEDPKHIEALSQYKTQARRHRRIHSLIQAIPAAKAFLENLAERGNPMGPVVKRLMEFMYAYGTDHVSSALQEALKAATPHLAAVQQILERNWHNQGKRPALPLPLPADPRIQNMIVKPHALKSYDQIREDDDGSPKS